MKGDGEGNARGLGGAASFVAYQAGRHEADFCNIGSRAF